MIRRPHHDGSELYVSDPAPALGDTVGVFVRVPRGTGVSRVHMRWVRDGEPVFASAVVDRRSPSGDTWWRADLPAHNPVTRYRFLLGTTSGVRWLTAFGLTAYDVPDSTDFRLVAHPAAPAWARDAVVYQIFPDRYARSAAADLRETPDWAIRAAWDEPVVPGPDATRVLYGGDLDGIAHRLDHVSELGADTVYLTPFFAARSNHRYDASGFDQVDPLLGGDGALERLSAAARERGIRLIGDLTTNHTGDTHPWFASRPDFYYAKPGGGYVSWLDLPSLPKLNWSSAELREEFREIARRWLAEPYGLSGWRIDVANMTARFGADDFNHEVAALLSRAVSEARPDGLLIAEHGHDATGDLDRGGWHGTMNYAGFTRPLWCWLRAETVPFDGFLGRPEDLPRLGADALVATMSAFASQMSWRSWQASWQLLGSHDTARIRTVVGDADRQHVAAGLLLTLPGTPMIFAGDELGLTGGGNETARAPMPWDRPDTWDTTTLGRYRDLIALRRTSPALTRGGLRWVHADGDSLVFLRECADQSVLVLAARAPYRVRLTGLPPDTILENLYGGTAPLHIEPDGSIAVDGAGPAVLVWALP